MFRKIKPNLYDYLTFNIFFYCFGSFYSIFKKKAGLLIYLGANKGNGLVRIFYKFEKCIAFEANPKLYIYLKKKFKNKVKIYNLAVGNSNRKINLNLYDNDSTNASIDRINGKIIKNKIQVKMVRLSTFLKKNNINNISFLLTDLEGLDFQVIKDLKYLIKEKKINYIQHECTKDKNRNYFKTYKNNEKLFIDLLNNNYKKIGSGFGVLKEGIFEKLPKNYRFKDILWKKK